MKKGLTTALIVLISDQISKQLVLDFFTTRDEVFKITDFFNLVLRFNRGISFSLFHKGGPLTPWILTLVSLSVCGVIIHWIKQEKNPKNVIFFGMILGGALGNVVDRIRFGAVVDFLDFHIGQYAWPAFNVADSAICVGAFLLIFYNIFFSVQDEQPVLEKKEDK